MTAFTLYATPGTCSLAPHIVLREAGADFTLVRVALDTHLTEDGRDFHAVNPKGYVPALELADGSVLTEGPAITQFIADALGAAELAPAPGTLERARVQEDLTFIGTEIHKSFSPLFDPSTPEETRRAARARIRRRFDQIEARLSDGRAYLHGAAFTVADAYLFAVSGWAEPRQIDLAAWPHLIAFRTRVAARPHVQAALAAEA
jgi:glutathione S-transferase